MPEELNQNFSIPDNVFSAPAGDVQSAVSYVPNNIFEQPLVVGSYLSDADLTAQATKAHFALREDSPGIASLKEALSTGSIMDIRKQQASKMSQDYNSYKYNLLKDIASKRPAEVGSYMLDYILQANKAYQQDPRFALEASFARHWVNDMISKTDPNTSGVYKDAFDKAAEETLNATAFTKGLVARTQAVLMNHMDLEAQYSKMPWLSVSQKDKTTDLVLNMVPFYGWLDIHRAFKDAPDSSFWPGKDIEAKVQWFYNLPEDKVPEALDQLKEHFKQNPTQALRLSRALMNYSKNEAFLDNLFAVGDLTTLSPALGAAGKGISKFGTLIKGAKTASRLASEGATEATGALNLTDLGKGTLKAQEVISDPRSVAFYQAQHALRDGVIASSDEGINPVWALTRTGDIPNASVFAAAREISDRFSLDTGTTLKPLTLNAHFWYNPGIYFEAANAAAGEGASRLASKALELSQELKSGLENAMRVTRVEPGSPAYTEMLARNKNFYLEGFGNNIQDAHFNTVPKVDPIANTTSVDFWFGQPKDGSMFASEADAFGFMKANFKDEFRIEQQGGSFFGVITKPMRETFSEIRDQLIETTGTKTPKTWSGMFLGPAKTADDLLSYFNNINRKTAGVASSRLKQIVVETFDEIKSIGVEGRKELRKVFEHDKILDNPSTPGTPGIYRDTISDFRKIFLDLNGKLPSEAQEVAYQRIAALDNFDGVLRQLDWTRDLHRQGVEMVRFDVPGKGPSEYFPGRRLERIPYESKTDQLIVALDNSTGLMQSHHTFDRDISDFKKLVDDRIKSGELKVIEIANTRSRPLSKYLEINAPVNILVTNSASFKPLQLGDAAPWAFGGHHVYDNAGGFLKQLGVSAGYKGNLYDFGDKTIFHVASEKEGRTVEKLWMQAQDLMNAGKDEELKTFLAKNFETGMTVSQFKQLYTASGPGGGLKGDMPVVFVKSGQDIFDARPELLQKYPDIKRTIVNDIYSNLDKRFIAERGQVLNTLVDVGTEGNPMIRMDKPQFINPYDTLNRALQNSIKGRWMGDYKTMAAEHWLQEFAPVIDGPNLEEMRKNPIFWLLNGDVKKDADRAVMAQAKNAQTRIKNFLGHQSELSKDLRFVESMVADKIGVKMDPDSWKNYFATGLRDFIANPADLLRSTTFHLKFAFNPSQFFKQAVTWNNIAALAPEHVLQSTAGYALQRAILHSESEKALQYAAKMATKFGWKAEDFIESTKALKRSGWYNVGSETAFKDVADETLMQTKLGAFLDKGAVFFNEGERMTRLTAWNAAYREWKKANPSTLFDDYAAARVLNRADDMSGNMTRMSLAQMQQGLGAVTTQFMGYQWRMTELMLGGLKGGGRISRAEAARMLGLYSAMFGIPAGLGTITGAVYNPYEDIKIAAKGQGIDIHDNWFKIMHDGLGAYALGLASGQDFNVAQSYGPGGNDAFRQLFHGDKKWWEILGGAAGSTVVNGLSALYPFTMSTYFAFTGNPGKFPLTTADFVDAAKEISAANNFLKMWYGLSAHRYLSKNDKYLADINDQDAIFIGLFGLTPRNISDAFVFARDEKHAKASRDELIQVAQTNYRRAIKAFGQGDQELGNKFMRRASALLEGGNLTFAERSKAFRQAITENQSAVDRIENMMQLRTLQTPQFK